ncbi:hypothetical protein [Kiloniella antarctica]|uniref:DUF4760 domain-containing protein n=1 Tax=Kiloniella antarctica TaxID=1550907 RepID=A0ABW5BQI8_9PROT
MIEIAIILLTLLGSFCLKKYAKWGLFSVAQRREHREKFYAISYQLIESEKITPELLERINLYSETLGNKRAIDLVISALSEVVRDKKTIPATPRPDIPPEIEEDWSLLNYHWVRSVMARPSLKGLVAFGLFLKITVLDKEIKNAAPHIAKSYARQHLTAA